MFERIKTLTLLQLSNKTRAYVRGSKRKYAQMAIRALIIVLITVVVTLLFHVLKNILYMPVNEYFFIFILILTQGLNIGVSTFGLTNDLYRSKDNQILFSLAVKNDEIFLSKLMVYYINEFIRNLFLLIPICLGFGIILSQGFLYYLTVVLLLFVLPVVSVGIASVISMPLAMALNFLKRHNLISGILTIILILLAFYLTVFLTSKIVYPIRIVQLYNRFVISLTLFIQNVAGYGTIYTIMGKLLFGFKYLLNLGIVLFVSLAILAVNYFVSKPVYFKLMSYSQEHTVKKEKKRKPKESKTLFLTFLRKEFTIARRSLNELLHDYALLLTLPFFMHLLNYIYMGMKRSSFGNQIVLVLNVIITLLIVTGSNTSSAVAITTEGYEFILLKSAPYNTSKMAWAKIAFNFFATTFIITLSFLLFSRALPVFPQKNIWLLYVFVIIVNFGHILWSFQIDLLSPKLSDYALTGSLSDNENIKKSLTNGLILAICFGLIAIVAFVFFKTYSWLIMIGLAVLFLLYRFFWFKTYLKAFFDDIEY